jgi:hypothetical protein
VSSNHSSGLRVPMGRDGRRTIGVARVRVGAIVAAAMTLLVMGVVPAQAGVWDKGSFAISGEEAYDTCGGRELGFEVDDVMDARVNFVLVPHGPDGLPYWISTAHGTRTWSNVATGATLTSVFDLIDRDLHVTDNRDGTFTLVVLAAGGERWYGPDGRLLFRNPGQVRYEALVTSDGDFEFVGVVKESTGRNDTDGRDFCEDLRTYIGS